MSVQLTACVTWGCGVVTSQAGGEWVSFGAQSLRVLRAELSSHVDGDEWHDQRRSPLVSHCATVQARIEAGLPGARIEGGRYLLTTAALAEELANGAT